MPSKAAKKYSNFGPHQFTQPLCAVAPQARIVCAPRPSIPPRAQFNVMSFSLRGRVSLLQGPGTRDERGQAALPRPQAPAQQHGASHGRCRRSGSVRVEASLMGQRLATGGARAACLPSSSLRSSAPRRSRRGAVRVNAMFERFTEKAIKAGGGCCFATTLVHAPATLASVNSPRGAVTPLPAPHLAAGCDAGAGGGETPGPQLCGHGAAAAGSHWRKHRCVLAWKSLLLVTLKCCLPVQAADNHQMHLVRVCWTQRCVGTFLNAGFATLRRLKMESSPWARVASFLQCSGHPAHNPDPECAALPA